MLEADTVYARRTHRVGYGIYANGDHRKGYSVGRHTGFPFACELLGRHTLGREEGTPRLSLRRLAAMPSNFTGIDGPVLSAPVHGNMHTLPYCFRNGFGSLLNSDLHSECTQISPRGRGNADTLLRPEVGMNSWALRVPICWPPLKRRPKRPSRPRPRPRLSSSHLGEAQA